MKKKSWDEVFDNPIPKGASIDKLKKKFLLEGQVYLTLREILLQDPERAIDAGIFEEAGEKFGLGKTATEKYYRSMVKQGCEPLTEIKKKIDEPMYQLLRKNLQK